MNIDPKVYTGRPTHEENPEKRAIYDKLDQLGISYILYVKASVFCPPLACCLLGAVEPLLNPVWVFLFDGERPGLFALIGSVIVIVSITVWCIFGKEKAVSTGENHA